MQAEYDSNNIFARILRGELPCFKVYEDADTIAFMDIMPQSDGHTLVVPKEQAVDVFGLSEAGAAAAIRATQIVARGVREAFQPDGVVISQFLIARPRHRVVQPMAQPPRQVPDAPQQGQQQACFECSQAPGQNQIGRHAADDRRVE